MLSCAATYQGKHQPSPVVSKTEVYQLKVRLIVSGFDDPLAGVFTPYFVDSIYINYLDFGPLRRSEIVTLFFRFTDLKELNKCRDLLLNIGNVQQISMTKY